MALVRTDVVGSTPLALQLGDDEAGDVMLRHLRLMQAVVDTHKGEVIKLLGDGLVAAFDAASTAVRASQDMQASIHRHNVALGNEAPIHIRVGVSVGDVTRAGEEIGGRPGIEVERLQATAEPDQIVCSRAVAELSGGRFDRQLRSLGPRALKGYPTAVEVFEVRWDPADAGSAELNPTLRQEPRTPFVARDAVVTSLLDRWHEAASGRPGAVFVVGEAGIGKSRVVREVAVRAHDQGGVVLFGRCTPERNQPYGPFAEALDHFVTQVQGHTYRLGSRAGDLARLLPDGLVGRLPDLARSPPGEALDSGMEAERAVLRDAVWAWIAEASTDEVLLVVVEDVHWADESTVAVLDHVVSSLRFERLLLVATMRDPPGDRSTPGLARLLRRARRAAAFTEVALSGLTSPESLEFVRATPGYSVAAHDEHDFARRLWRHTGGNPLFIEAVLNHLAARDPARDRVGRDSPATALGDIGVPKAVQDVVLGHLASMGSDDRTVLHLAALLDAEIDLGLLSSVAERIGLDAPRAVERALEQGLLAPAEATPDCLRFSHEIVREAVIGDVPMTRRSGMHRDIAYAMQRRYASMSEGQLEALSRHLSFLPEQADRIRAAVYASDAAALAESRAAREKAASLYRRSAELLEGTGEDVGRCDALLNAGRAAKRAGDPTARDALIDAARLADRLGDGERMARAAIACSRGMFSSLGAVDADLVEVLERALALLADEDSPLRASVLAVLGAELVYSRDRARHHEASEEAVSMARRLGDPASLSWVLNLYASTLWRPDRVARRLELTAELERITAGLGRPQWRFSAASIGFQAAVEAGLFELVDERLQRMESLARQLDQPVVWAYLRLRQAQRQMIAGNLVEAERLANEALERSRAAGHADSEYFYYGQMWTICYHCGRLEEMVGVFEFAVAARPHHTVLRAALAALYGEVGRPEQCRDLTAQLGADDFTTMDQDLLVTAAVATIAASHVDDVRLATILQSTLRPYQDLLIDNGSAHFGAVSHYQAVLAGIVGDPTEAIGMFQRAAATHAHLREWPMLARTWLEHGRLLARSPEPEAASASRDLFDRALRLAHDHELAGTVATAERELEGLRSRTA
jgi:class 3 adenylate cyclase